MSKNSCKVTKMYSIVLKTTYSRCASLLYNCQRNLCQLQYTKLNSTDKDTGLGMSSCVMQSKLLSKFIPNQVLMYTTQAKLDMIWHHQFLHYLSSWFSNASELWVIIDVFFVCFNVKYSRVAIFGLFSVMPVCFRGYKYVKRRWWGRWSSIFPNGSFATKTFKHCCIIYKYNMIIFII
jgi:hypothetical protein